jgi:hypothetical protein
MYAYRGEENKKHRPLVGIPFGTRDKYVKDNIVTYRGDL